MIRRLRPPDLIAGLGGLLLFVSLFLPWYDEVDVTRDEGLPQPEFVLLIDASATAWQYFTVMDIALTVVALLAVTAVARPTARAATICTLAVPLVAFEVLVAPDPVSVDGFELTLESAAGAWLGLAGAVVAAAGSWLNVRGQRRPAPPA